MRTDDTRYVIPSVLARDLASDASGKIPREYARDDTSFHPLSLGSCYLNLQNLPHAPGEALRRAPRHQPHESADDRLLRECSDHRSAHAVAVESDAECMLADAVIDLYDHAHRRLDR